MSKSLTIASLSDPREAMFVATLLELGGPQHAGAAALRAGYAETSEDAERAAAFLLGAPRITRAISGEIKARFDTAAAAAFATLVEVCADKKAPANARIAAAESILNRSSIGPVPSRSMSFQATGTVDELIKRLDAEERARGAAGAQTIDGTPTAVD